MADWGDIARRANAAREFTHEIEGRKFTLRILSADELRILVLENNAADFSVPDEPAEGEEPSAKVVDSAAEAAALVAWEKIGRGMVERSIVGWDGVLLSDIIENADPTPLEFDPAGVPLLLREQPAWTVQLRLALNRETVARTKRREAAAKN